MVFSTSEGNVTGGTYDNAARILTVTDNARTLNGYNPVGHVNVSGKSISGTLRGLHDFQFTLTYWES